MHALMLRRESQFRPRDLSKALRSRRFRRRMLLPSLVLLAATAGACNALDAPGPKGSVVVIPVDDRPAQLTAAPPAPISGGTLAISADGMTAVAADPDRDRVSVVDLNGGTVQHIALTTGDEPGRVVLDGAGRAFVALRRGGALAVIDVTRGELVERVPVCAAPRGMAFDAAQGLLHVACMEGRLLSLRNPVSAVTVTTPTLAPVGGTPATTLPTAGLEIVRDLHVELDLRDVMLRGDQLWVSTFKRAELLQVSDAGVVRSRIAPSAVAEPGVVLSSGPSGSVVSANNTLLPHLAYRSMADAAGNMFVLHQAESDAEIAIDHADDSQSASPYGGAGGCSGIVTPALTTVDKTGRVTTMATTTGVLSVDMAFSPEDQMIAVVQAGGADSGAPQRQVFFDDEGGDFGSAISAPGEFRGDPGGSGTVVSLLDMKSQDGQCKFGSGLFVSGQSTAIAFRPAAGANLVDSTQPGWVVQSREPAQLTLLSIHNAFSGGETHVISLGGDSVRDSGHEIFHRDAGGGIACASCHAEGGEDGHVWHFTTLGARRTQALHVGLEGTAPFHWGGDESDMDKLMSDVFVGRMGGVHQSGERVSALTRWLFALQPPAAPTVVDSSAVERGRELFLSAEVGCSDCHSGFKLTNNKNVNVGTGASLQVPSLRGIAYRAPFMHDGCATTLRDRFSAACGGESHGHTRDLAPESLDDLVAYLQTL